MGSVIGFLFALWIIGAMWYAPYCWWKRTDKSDAPIVRRFKALGMGLLWPYDIYRHFAHKAEREAQAKSLEQAEKDILG